MERCARCKVEGTELYESGVPICLKCVALRGAKPQKDRSASIQDILIRDLADATLRAESATTEFNSITSDIPSSIPPPDGTQRIHNASRAMKVARDEKIMAHNRLNAFLERGIVPEDLKRG